MGLDDVSSTLTDPKQDTERRVEGKALLEQVASMATPRVPKNGILHGPERHSLELHANRRVTEILLQSGEVAEDHDIVKIIHWEASVTEEVDHQIVVLLRKLPFLKSFGS